MSVGGYCSQVFASLHLLSCLLVGTVLVLLAVTCCHVCWWVAVLVSASRHLLSCQLVGSCSGVC